MQATAKLCLAEILTCDATHSSWTDVGYDEFEQHVHDSALQGDIAHLRLKQVYSDLRFFLTHRFSYELDNGRLLCVARIDGAGDDTLRIGWVPPATAVGDKVCYVGGIPYPLIVRANHRINRFSIQGDAWFAWRDGERYPRFGFRYPAPDIEVRDDGYKALAAADHWYQSRAKWWRLS